MRLSITTSYSSLKLSEREDFAFVSRILAKIKIRLTTVFSEILEYLMMKSMLFIAIFTLR